MFSVETNAPPHLIQNCAEDVLDVRVTIRNSGRLGSEVVLEQAEAEQLADRLREDGHEVLCDDRESPRDWQARSGQEFTDTSTGSTNHFQEPDTGTQEPKP